MTDKKPTKKRSIPKARLLVEVDVVRQGYELELDATIAELLDAISQAIVDEQVAALN